MIDVEDRLRDELDRSVPAFRPADWNEVLAISNGPQTGGRGLLVFSSRKQRRVALLLVATVVLVIVAAPALGLSPPFLDFFSSKHASKRVVQSFAVLNVTAPRGMSPKVIAGESRLLTTYHVRDGTAWPLVVAPTRLGGFCFTLGSGGGCALRQDDASRHDQPGDHNAGAIELGRYGSRVLAGSVFDQRIARIEIRFKRAPAASVPLLWVSPPINAGFFFYELPRESRQPGAGPVAVVALDADGREVARDASMFRPLPVWSNPAAVSDRAKRHTILRSGRLSIAVAPSRTGGDCYWLKVDTYQGIGSGCAPPRYLTTPMAGGLRHGTGFTGFTAQVRPAVSQVVLRFEDGVHLTLQPIDGHVLYDIPTRHWLRGHRLRTATAYTANSKAVARQVFDTTQTGVYDCAKPAPIGAGQTACP
jgi:hypothetical protein